MSRASTPRPGKRGRFVVARGSAALVAGRLGTIELRWQAGPPR
jgi:hypothetical protein